MESILDRWENEKDLDFTAMYGEGEWEDDDLVACVPVNPVEWNQGRVNSEENYLVINGLPFRASEIQIMQTIGTFENILPWVTTGSMVSSLITRSTRPAPRENISTGWCS